MPLDGAAKFGVFHVEFVTIMAHAGANQLLNDIEDTIMAQRLVINNVVCNGILNTAHTRAFWSMSRFKVKHIGMFTDLTGFFNKLIRSPLKISNLFRREHIFDAEVTVFIVKVNLFLG